MAIDDSDLHQLQHCLRLAESVVGLTEPNPRVGCVLAEAGGRVVGSGATREAGAAHVEVMALRDVDG